jgi:hypothetical protein
MNDTPIFRLLAWSQIYSSVVEHLPSMIQVLSLILNSTKTQKAKKYFWQSVSCKWLLMLSMFILTT